MSTALATIGSQEWFQQKEAERLARGNRQLDRFHRRWQRRNALERLARELMDQHGLKGWYLGDLEEDLRVNGQQHGKDMHTWGICRPVTDKDRASLPENLRDIKSSIHLAMGKASKKSIRWQKDLILHEIAHALAYALAGVAHNEEWATVAERIGIRPLSLVYDLHVNSKESKEARAAFQKRRAALNHRQRIVLARRMVRGDR